MSSTWDELDQEEREASGKGYDDNTWVDVVDDEDRSVEVVPFSEWVQRYGL